MKGINKEMAGSYQSEYAQSCKMQVKVYLVLQRHNLAKAGAPNVTVIAACLTRKAAQDIVDSMPGTFVEKHVASK